MAWGRGALVVGAVLAAGCPRCGGCELSLPLLERPREVVVAPPREPAPAAPVDAGAPAPRATTALVEPDDGREELEEPVIDPGDEPEPRASWRGRVLRPDGTPLTGVSAQVELLSRYQVAVVDGGFAFERVLPGRYRVAVGLFDCGEYGEYKQTEWGDRVVRFKTTLAPGEQRVEDLRLPAGRSITGVMQRPDGGAFGDWWVKLSPPGADLERGIEGGSLRAQTDSHGHFEFHHVPPGEWRLMHGGPSQHRSVAFTRLPVQPGDRDVVFRVVEE
jgi:hypothetical protein